jgi:hypothetical protein
MWNREALGRARARTQVEWTGRVGGRCKSVGKRQGGYTGFMRVENFWGLRERERAGKKAIGLGLAFFTLTRASHRELSNIFA